MFLRIAIEQSGRLNKEANQAPSANFNSAGIRLSIHGKRVAHRQFRFLFPSYLSSPLLFSFHPSPATRHNERILAGIGASSIDDGSCILDPSCVGKFRGQGNSFEVSLIRFMTR